MLLTVLGRGVGLWNESHFFHRSRHRSSCVLIARSGHRQSLALSGGRVCTSDLRRGMHGRVRCERWWRGVALGLDHE